MTKFRSVALSQDQKGTNRNRWTTRDPVSGTYSPYSWNEKREDEEGGRWCSPTALFRPLKSSVIICSQSKQRLTVLLALATVNPNYRYALTPNERYDTTKAYRSL